MKVVFTQRKASYVEGEAVCRCFNRCFFLGGVNQARVQESNKATKMGLGQ